MSKKDLPNPLSDDFGKERPAIRILSDRGIKQAVRAGYLNLLPVLDLDNPGKRLQPVTIDLAFRELQSCFSPGMGNGEFLDTFGENFDGCLRAGKVHWVSFEERIMFENAVTKMNMPFFSYFLDGKSSLLRLGGLACPPIDQIHFLGIDNIIFNTSPNNIIVEPNERIAQSFIRVAPFAETYLVPFDVGDKPKYTLQGESIRSLDMGVQVKTNKQLEALVDRGFMKVERGVGKRFTPWEGIILLHAKDAFRMKKIEGGIKFSERAKYSHEDLFESVDIRTKYDIKEGEHLVVEVEEKFDLSDRVGISVLNNLIGKNIPGGVDLRAFIPLDVYAKGDVSRSLDVAGFNFHLKNLRCSWIDPGYNGMMTAFPKLLGKSVQRGDIVGYGQVFYFPKGVERPYASSPDLGSQFQGQKMFQLAAK
ncbi:MAG: hypothetical protein AABX35_02850 [Nanoarchaeota archaeon]